MALSRPVVNALTIDFEDWYQGLEIPFGKWNGYEERIEQSGRRLLAVLARAGARATFFVLGRVAETHPHLVREIAAAGHEIASHGWDHHPFPTLAWNALEVPAMSIPMGFTDDGLPLGLQLIGPWFGEADVLRVGDAYQQRTDWHERVPA